MLNDAAVVLAANAVDTAITHFQLHSTSRSCRNKVDLSAATEARLVAGVGVLSSTAGSSFKLSYCTVENATWASGTGVADAGPVVVVGSTGGVANTIHDSGWVSLAAGARIDSCYLTLLVGTALGTTAPTVGFVTAYFR